MLLHPRKILLKFRGFYQTSGQFLITERRKNRAINTPKFLSEFSDTGEWRVRGRAEREMGSERE